VGGPPGSGVRGSGGEGRLPPGRRVARWGGSGGGAAPPPASISGSYRVSFSLNDVWGLQHSTDAGLTTSGAARGRLPTGCLVVRSGGRRVAGWGGPGGRTASPPAVGWRSGGGPGGRAASPPAAGWRGGGGPWGRVASPPAAGWQAGGVRGHGLPLPLAYKAAPRSSILRTGNELFSLWKSSRFYRPGGTFSRSSALCISGTAALRTNLSSSNGGRVEAWANVCKLLNELGRVVLRRFHENASVGQVRK